MEMPDVAGLYAITPEERDSARLLARVEGALEGGARVVQYRSKDGAIADKRAQARSLQRLCERYRVPLIINDSLELALDCGAAGCHLGGGDGDIAAARAALGPERVLGVSCYDSLERAIAARAQGADYIAFGSVFPSSSKPRAVRAPLALFAAARRHGLDCPLVGIGGITADNIDELIGAGASAAAVIAALFCADSREGVRTRARSLACHFSTTLESNSVLP